MLLVLEIAHAIDGWKEGRAFQEVAFDGYYNSMDYQGYIFYDWQRGCHLCF